MADLIPPHEESDLVRKTREYAIVSRQIDELQDRKDGLKEHLLVYVEMQGREDDKGHDYLELPDAVEGIYGLQRQHRVSRSTDENAIESILKAKGLYEECVKIETVVDDDAVAALAVEGKISPDELDEMYPPKKSYAFKPLRVK